MNAPLSSDDLLFPAIAVFAVALAVIYRRVSRSTLVEWRDLGVWAFALVVPIANSIDIVLLIFYKGDRDTAAGWVHLTLWPPAISLVPFAIAQWARYYRAGTYYALVIPLTLFGWAGATCVIALMLDS